MMEAAIRDVHTLAIDSAPLIYLIERHPVFGPPMLAIGHRLDAGTIEVVSPTLTLIEVLAHPIRRDHPEIAAAYRHILERHPAVRLIELDVDVALRAAELRARYNLRTPDAVQIASALHAGASAFLTNDSDLSRVTELRVIQLTDLIER